MISGHRTAFITRTVQVCPCHYSTVFTSCTFVDTFYTEALILQTDSEEQTFALAKWRL